MRKARGRTPSPPRGRWRRPQEDRALEHLLATHRRPGDEEHSPPRLLCARCRARVTTAEDRFEMQGGHRHVFVNPSGLVFEIGCFRKAPGCVSASPPTFEFTWFPGYAWQIALCRHCGEHLGWAYSGASRAGFFGLMLDRLLEERPENRNSGDV